MGAATDLDSGGSALCWRCGFDLSRLDGDAVCPECALLVSVARQEAPLPIRSRTQKWLCAFALLGFVPFLVLGFLCRIVASLSGGHIAINYGETTAFALASIAGVAAGWFMRSPVPTREFTVLSCPSMVLCAVLFLFGPIKALSAGLLGNVGQMLNSNLFLVIMMCALATLSLQARIFAQRMGMGKPIRHAISFNEVSRLAFVSAGLMALGALLLVSNLFLLTSRFPRLTLGFGVLLGIIAMGLWTLCIFPIVCRLVRWPIGRSPKTI